MKIIMSVDRIECSKGINAYKRKLFKQYLKSEGYTYELAKGTYKGIEEQIFIVDLIPTGYSKVSTIAKVFNQESILLVYSKTGDSWLIYMGEAPIEYIGIYQEVSKEKAISLDNYTETKDGFFACIKK